MALKKIPKNIKFEEALADLEATVDKLESGELPLEEAIEQFKYGTELSQICLEKLNRAKAEVAKLKTEAAAQDKVETEEFGEFEQETLSGDGTED